MTDTSTGQVTNLERATAPPKAGPLRSGGTEIGSPARAGDPSRAVAGVDEHRHEPVERGEDRESEGDESRGRDVGHDPEPPVHAPVIGVVGVPSAGSVGVIFRWPGAATSPAVGRRRAGSGAGGGRQAGPASSVAR